MKRWTWLALGHYFLGLFAITLFVATQTNDWGFWPEVFLAIPLWLWMSAISISLFGKRRP